MLFGISKLIDYVFSITHKTSALTSHNVVVIVSNQAVTWHYTSTGSTGAQMWNFPRVWRRSQFVTELTNFNIPCGTEDWKEDYVAPTARTKTTGIAHFTVA